MRIRRSIALAAFIAVLATAAGAHDLGFSRTIVAFLDDGAFQIDVTIDLDALAVGAPQDADDDELVATLEALTAAQFAAAVQGVRDSLARRLRVRFDNETYVPEIEFPQLHTAEATAANTVLGLTARLTGTVPRGATEFSIQASRALPPLHVTFVDVRSRGYSAARLDELLHIDADAVADASSDDDVARLGDLVTGRQILDRGDRSAAYPLDRPPPPPSRFEVFSRYLELGFTHIVPLGIDHILFVLGLYLLNSAWRPLLAQVTAFTLAHTLALGLSTYGVLSLPASIVEPLIALSIAFVAFENVYTDELTRWRTAVVFGFGLLHGLGFAGALAELGLPRQEYLGALLSFNVGVELGQLTVILAAFAILGGLRKKPWYRHRVTVPASVAIGLVGLAWALQRIW